VSIVDSIGMNTVQLDPTPLRISTKVITANVGTQISPKNLFESIATIMIPLWYPGEGILKMEYEKQVLGMCTRDAFSKRTISDKTFFNQSTIVLRKATNKEHTEFKEVNIKLFGNGGIQMTGIPYEDFAKETLEWLIKQFTLIKPKTQTIKLEGKKENEGDNKKTYMFPGNSLPYDILENTDGTEHLFNSKKAFMGTYNPKTNILVYSLFTETPTLQKFKVQLINSDYQVKYGINRNALHTILSRVYGLFSTFESTIYQGVNTKYYYNKQHPDSTRPGICLCDRERRCRGQGSGEGPGECKKITLSVFQTGKIIITGAREYEQLDEAYKFLNTVLVKHARDILRTDV